MAGGTLLSLWAKKQATPASKGPEGSCAAKSEGVEESRSPSSESPVVPLCADASEGAGGRTEEDSAYPVNSASKVALSPSADQKDQGAQGLRLETRLGPGAAEEEDPDSRAALLFSLRKEEARVRSIVMETPPLSAAGKAKDVAMPAEGLQASEVARMIHGSGEPLSSLSVSLSESLGVTNPTAVHNCIISLAVRTSFAAKDSRADTVDALEDVTEDLLWRWTVRDVKVGKRPCASLVLSADPNPLLASPQVMNKEDRAEASKLTKQLQGWQQRLSLLREAVSMLEAATWERLPAKGKLPKLLSRLDKLGSSADGAFELRKATAGAKVAKTGEGKDTKESKAKTKDSPGREKGIAGDGKSEDAVAAGKADAHVQIAVPSESTAKKTGKENLTTGNGDEKGSLMAEKKRLKAEQESLQAEKKRLKAEKERLKSEKERLKAEKEAEREADKQKAMAEKERTRAAREEKERLKAEKEAEKVRLRLEKEAEAAEVKKKRQAEEEEGHAKRKAARLGFGSSKQLESAQGVMQVLRYPTTSSCPSDDPPSPFSGGS